LSALRRLLAAAERTISDADAADRRVRGICVCVRPSSAEHAACTAAPGGAASENLTLGASGEIGDRLWVLDES